MMRGLFRFRSVLALLILLAAGGARAVAPTDEAIAKWKANGTFDQVMANWKAFHDRGGDSPSQYPPFKPQAFASKLAQTSGAIDTIRVIVLLVDFSDNAATALPIQETRQMFDSLLFSDSAKHAIVNPTGSMTDYYREVTGGKVYIRGDVVGWLRMPNTYAYYVGADNGLSKGPELARDAVVAADPTVNFNLYDMNGDAHVDGLIIVHAGAGAEEGGYGIWSHKGIVLNGGYMADGVLAYEYTLNPSLAGGVMVPIGVFCHEYGHVLGLPDLYNTTYTPPTSKGLGRWSLMASGNYNGNGKTPAHLDAWCKIRLGSLLSGGFSIVNLIDVASNQYQAPIPQTETTPTVYRISERIGDLMEYWLVENRQLFGFDKGLPGPGLLIYHIDDAVNTGNNNYLHYMVGLEQADGRNDLSLGDPHNVGDAGDPYPGASNNRTFDDMSNPNSRNYRDTATTEIAVWQISNSGSTMYANLDMSFSHPRVKFSTADSVHFDDAAGGNGNGVPEAGENVDFYCTIRNWAKQSFGWTMILSCNNPSVIFDVNSVSQPGPLNPIFTGVTNANPIHFHLPIDFKPSIVSFTLIIASDSVMSSGDKRYRDTLYFSKAFGVPQVLVVDDDNGGTFDRLYAAALTGLREPFTIWRKITAGSPTSADLNKYHTVFWFNGDPITGGHFTALDVAAMKDFLDHGHCLAITSFHAGDQLNAVDSTFMLNYLHCRWTPTSDVVPIVRGRVGNLLSSGLMYRLSSGTPSFIKGNLEPIGGGDTAFYPAYNSGTIQPGCAGVTYAGSFRTFFLAMPMEYFESSFGDPPSPADKNPMDSLIAYTLNFMNASSVLGVDDGDNSSLPQSFTLEQNYPNPFNPDTKIEYTLGVSTQRLAPRTNLAVFNLLGQKVVTLVDEVQSSGRHSITWDGTDASGRKVASGIYFYRLERGGEAQSRKMVLLK